MLRDTIAEALKTAQEEQDKRRVSTLRLILAAIQDRDIAHRGAGKGPVTNDDVTAILSKMVKQREESARLFDDGGRPDLAAEERAENVIIHTFLPKQLADDEVQHACRAVISEVGADGLRDIGRCMNALKEKYPGRMDFSKASGIVKTMLK